MSFLAKGQAPVADFSTDVTSGCAPLVVHFTDQSSGSPTSWIWDFGPVIGLRQGSTTAVAFPAGTYSVTLTVRNANGINSVTKTNIIVSNPSPSANFTADKTIACLPGDIHFTDQSTPNAGTIVKWTWDFGDHTQDMGQNPEHIYNTVGYYTVSLSVVSSTGCSSTGSRTRYIRITDGVKADFSYAGPTTCQPPFTIAYTNLTSGPGNLSYAWDLSPATTTQTSPSATYSAAGNYVVTLTATSDYGCSANIQKTIPVNGSTTTFQTVGNKDSVCFGQPISFQSTASPAPAKVVWHFGDSTTYTGLVPPAHTYTSPGNYTVTMNADFANCSSVATKTITVLNLPSVDFGSSNSNSFCKAPAAVVLQDLSPNVVSAQWNFGDNSSITSTTNPITHTYTSAGNFPVSLTVTDNLGCQNTLTKPSFVNITPPQPAIANVPAGLCKGQTYTPSFSGYAQDGIASYDWDFGDGVHSSSANPTHSYSATGTYIVKLTVTTNGGCTATAVASTATTVGDPPVVDFTKDLAVICHSASVQFTNLSTPVNSPPNPVLWNFGDGTVSTLQNPAHKFPDSGLYTIKLTVTNNGCSDSLAKTNFVHVLPPVANFGYRVPDCANRTSVIFADSSINDPAAYGALSYQWNFGDGSATDVTQNPAHTYPGYNTYNAQLIISNAHCTDTVTKPVMILDQTAVFSIGKSVFCRNESIVFSSSNSPSLVKTYNWVVDGVSNITQQQSGFAVSYPVPGSHTAQLINTDINGCFDTSAIANFSVTGPTALFTIGNKGGCSNSTITFNDQSHSTGTLTKWVFDFGDGIIDTFTAPPFTHTYTNTGNYTVKLTVFDNTSSSCSDTYILADSAGAVITKPTPAFSAANTTFCPGTPLQFTDASAGNGLTYLWNFGDGSMTDTSRNPLHSYPGRDSLYSVTLIVKDSVGCADTLVKPNYINIRAPKPLYSVEDSTTLCPPLETLFTFLGQDYVSYSWDFGDGSGPSTLESPNHFYNTYGNYIAKLYVTGFGGCVDSASIHVTVVNPYVNTTYTFGPTEACNVLTTHFTVSTPLGSNFYFYFGDGNHTVLQTDTFSYTYNLPNVYSPFIFLTDTTGCQITIGDRGLVTIDGAIPIFGTDKNKFCDSGTVYFTNYSQQAHDPIVSSIWNFGDGSPSAPYTTDTIHTYAFPGLFAPTLTVTTAAGCIETFTDTIRVLATPTPVITSADAVCKNLSINFGGSLLVPPDTAITWKWTAGGKTYSDQNITINYPDTGLYHITLEATNSLGCKGDTAKDITIYPPPSIKITGDTSIIAGSAGIAMPLTYSANATTFNWTPATYLSCTDCANPFATPKFTTTYKVTVTDANGCVSSRDITLLVLCNNKNFFIPNTFSPNNDGSNDRFYPRGTGLDLIQAIRVFNRWGELVFEKRNFPANDALSGWDGTYKGKPAPVDTYIYMVDIICENASIITYKGNVTLIR